MADGDINPLGALDKFLPYCHKKNKALLYLLLDFGFIETNSSNSSGLWLEVGVWMLVVVFNAKFMYEQTQLSS